MGQISPLDQLISNSAFNDCSVTVIYSGVIITDVLLLCDGPSAPSPSSLCADVIVFFGTTSASFTVVLCIFVVSSSAKCTFASVAWLWNSSHGISWPTGLSSLSWETIANSSGPITAQPVQTGKTPTFDLSYFLSIKPLYHLFFITRCAYMCECEWMHVCMCPTCSCVRYRYAYATFWVPVCILPCWYKLVTAFAWTSLVVRDLLFSPELKKLEFDWYDSLIFISSCIYSLTTFDFGDS